MATPEKSGPEEQKSTPGRIKKEEYVLFKKSTPSAAKGKIVFFFNSFMFLRLRYTHIKEGNACSGTFY